MLKKQVLRTIHLLQNRLYAYVFAVCVTIVCTLIALGLSSWLGGGNLALIFVAGIIFVGLQAGVGPSLVAAALSFLCFNFFLTAPVFTFRVDSQDDVMTLVFMTAFGVLLSPVSSMLRQHVLVVESLQKAKLESEMEQLKNALLSSVSHDLRSPLSAMANAAEVLNHRASTLSVEDSQHLLSMIELESKRLNKYIQNLLDMTKLGYGRLKLNRDWITLTELFDSLLNRLRNEHPGVEVNVQLHDEDALLFVHGALIEQALFNILENACRFSPQGSAVTVRSSLRQDQVILEIEDRGPGIPKSERQHLFKMFSQIHERDRNTSHLGMGLAISLGMIRAHGGDIVFDTSYTQGSRFVVSLPAFEQQG